MRKRIKKNMKKENNEGKSKKSREKNKIFVKGETELTQIYFLGHKDENLSPPTDL